MAELPFRQVIVVGLPRQQGSHRVAYRGEECPHCQRRDAFLVADQNELLRVWRAKVKKTAAHIAALHSWKPFDVPVELSVSFYLQRRYETDLAREYPCERPDLDKLMRAIGDALSKVIYTDDKLIVRSAQEKLWAGNAPGARIRVREMPRVQQQLPLERAADRLLAPNINDGDLAVYGLRR